MAQKQSVLLLGQIFPSATDAVGPRFTGFTDHGYVHNSMTFIIYHFYSRYTLAVIIYHNIKYMFYRNQANLLLNF
ncbi:Uncharacterised protein [Serratia fonticola]|nr:hypothetical protein BSQ40_22305 [Serratia fonticola]CAI2028520.1 Uncharacterised protein [Serratia fonticola]